MKVVWRQRAEQQLRAQLDYLKGVSPQAEKRMRQRIKQRLGRLRYAPLTGRPSHLPSVRELLIAGTPYVAIYQVSDKDTITILLFFYCSEDRSQ